MPETCDHCGGPLTDGFEERSRGVDPETGYHDVEVLCAKCAEVAA